MTRQYLFTLQTPFWSGNIERVTETCRDTTILGGLRWWYEVILRGDGATACDPTSESDRCPKGEPPHWCEACELFGTTGWSRKFRLQVSAPDGQLQPDKDMVIFSPHRGQWRKGRGLMGNLTGRLTVLRPNAVIGESFSEVEAVIKCLLTIQSRCGAIGARNYLGYGVYQLKDTHNEIVCPSNEERLQFLTHIDKIKERKNRRLDLATGYPSLNEMFFYRIRFSEPIDRYAKDIRTLKRQRRQMRDKLGWEGVEPDVIQKCVNSGFVPVAPTVRYSLRGLFAGRTNESIRHEIFGEVSGSNKVGSKIAVSDFYRIGKEWELRIWGYIPPSLPNITSTRNKIDSNIRSATFWQTCFDISSLSGPSVDCQDIQRHGGNYRAFLEALMSW